MDLPEAEEILTQAMKAVFIACNENEAGEAAELFVKLGRLRTKLRRRITRKKARGFYAP